MQKIFCATQHSNPRRLTSCVASLPPHLHNTCGYRWYVFFKKRLTREGSFSPGWSHQQGLKALLVRVGSSQRRNQKFWIRGAEQILYTIREKHIKIYIRVTNILDRENALHMFCLHFTTSQTYCEFVFSFFHKIISNVFVFLVWPCFLKKIITYSLRPTKSVVLGNFRHITYLNKWLCYP